MGASGGIVGLSGFSSQAPINKINNCINTGVVVGDDGLTGCIVGDGNITITNC